MDRLLVAFGQAILNIVPGRVSTEVDARLSSTRHRRARAQPALYEAPASRASVLIKIASTWEGIQGARCGRRHPLQPDAAVLAAAGGRLRRRRRS